MTKEQFFPENVDISNDFEGSKFKRPEFEAIAKNLIVISRRKGEWLVSFTLQEYIDNSEHTVTNDEIRNLNLMVEKGFFVFGIKETYTMSGKMFEAYREYLKE